MTSATVKIRGGAERDRFGRKAGKGLLVQWDKSGTLSVSQDQTLIVMSDEPGEDADAVRRLTPLECERLNGMPDDWSRFGMAEDGTVYELPDSVRCSLQGNGIAVPFWRWLMNRVSAVFDETPTLGSLFDGQGSFPMLWEEANGSGTALWACEIDRHATDVSRYHFPEETE